MRLKEVVGLKKDVELLAMIFFRFKEKKINCPN